ncbi:MAG: HupE/UreJ family protein [Pseudomonadota bacterium]
MHHTYVTRARPERLLAALFVLLAAYVVAATAAAHPEDEICIPGQSAMDPLLCEQLAAMDRASDNTVRDVQPLVDEAGQPRSATETFGLYTRIGVDHILPGGLDHILFVMALVLTSTRLRPLVIQVTTFTLAHTVTLGLAGAGVISPPAGIVEPLIAASIAVVAIENVWVRDMPRWRPVVVFAFGLLHGLGFAGFFGELGLPPGQFWSALIGFNVGVEIGQIAIVLVTLAVLLTAQRGIGTADTKGTTTYRRWVVTPASLFIAGIGLWWAVERALLS